MSLVDASERLVALPQDESLTDSASEDVIVVDELRKRYEATEAVAGINLRVARGEIFAYDPSRGTDVTRSRAQASPLLPRSSTGLLHTYYTGPAG